MPISNRLVSIDTVSTQSAANPTLPLTNFYPRTLSPLGRFLLSVISIRPLFVFRSFLHNQKQKAKSNMACRNSTALSKAVIKQWIKKQ